MSILSDGIDSFAGSKGLLMIAFSWRWLDFGGRGFDHVYTAGELSLLYVRSRLGTYTSLNISKLPT